MKLITAAAIATLFANANSAYAKTESLRNLEEGGDVTASFGSFLDYFSKHHCPTDAFIGKWETVSKNDSPFFASPQSLFITCGDDCSSCSVTVVSGNNRGCVLTGAQGPSASAGVTDPAGFLFDDNVPYDPVSKTLRTTQNADDVVASGRCLNGGTPTTGLGDGGDPKDTFFQLGYGGTLEFVFENSQDGTVSVLTYVKVSV